MVVFLNCSESLHSVLKVKTGEILLNDNEIFFMEKYLLEICMWLFSVLMN